MSKVAFINFYFEDKILSTTRKSTEGKNSRLLVKKTRIIIIQDFDGAEFKII